ncbi:peptidoglycan-binding domain-containing protein [Streptomyces sp. NPDC001070]
MSGTEQGETTVRPLIGAGPAGPAPEYAELFPEDPPDTSGDTRELPPLTPDRAQEPRRHPDHAPRGTRRAAARSRRRTRTVVAVAGAALGVGVLALLGQLMTGPGEADRVLPQPSSSPPRLALPSLVASDGTATAPSASGTAPSSRAGASGGASPSVSGSASGAAANPSAGTATASGGAATTAAAGSGAVLKPGSRGPEVVALQQRLAQVQLYDGPADGKYDGGVKYAVQRYQQGYGVTGDASGVYGPATRRSLESVTSAP